MSDYKYIDEDVEFSGIKNTNVRVGQKIGAAKYVVDEEGNIISSRPVINAIDIDWNNANAEELEKPIKTSADLINEIIKTKRSIANISIPKSIYDLAGGTRVLTIDNFEDIKDELVGKSAFDIAKETAEQTGIYFPYQTEAEWISSLKGPKGDRGNDGTPGASAYQIAKLQNPNIGTESEWIASLKGASAFQIAQQTYESLGQDFPYSNEVEWMTAIISHSEDIEPIIEEKVNTKLASKQDKLTAGEGINIDSNNVISTTVSTWININD